MSKKQEENEAQKKGFVNPIDEDKITENPGTLPYAHTIGGAAIKPTEEGAIKGKALSAMEEQTGSQMKQIYDQMKVLAEQAEKLKARKEMSQRIYQATINFQPVIGHIYYLYQRESEEHVLSLISPSEWGNDMPFAQYFAKVRLLADHTWEVQELAQEFFDKNDGTKVEI